MDIGHIYVMAFSNGTVKVGRSGRGAKRTDEHKRAAQKFALTVVDEWMSPAHAEWHANEDELKKIALRLGGVQAGKEYFTGIAFADVVAGARKLTFTLPAQVQPKPLPAPAKRPDVAKVAAYPSDVELARFPALVPGASSMAVLSVIEERHREIQEMANHIEVAMSQELGRNGRFPTPAARTLLDAAAKTFVALINEVFEKKHMYAGLLHEYVVMGLKQKEEQAQDSAA
jgi:hypothetical protein